MSDQQWFYAVGNDTSPTGPLPVGTLKSMIESGRLPSDTRVWTEGMSGWESVSMRPEFTSGTGTIPFEAATASQPNAAIPQALSYLTPDPGRFRYAGFWLRLLASFVDFILLALVNFAVTFAIRMAATSVALPRQRGAAPLVTGSILLMQLSTSAIGWLYSSLMESSSLQATLGKMALGLVVTDEHGDRIGFGRATGRHFAKFISAIVLCVGYMMAGWTGRKQALHDLIAGTLVIRRR